LVEEKFVSAAKEMDKYLSKAILLIVLLGCTQLLSFQLRSHKVHLESRLQARYVSMSMSEKNAQIPLKVAIAGGGVGGVMLAYALQKKGFDVTVFEKTAKFSRFGGPLQLASNALSCVNALSPDLFEQIMAR